MIAPSLYKKNRKKRVRSTITHPIEIVFVAKSVDMKDLWEKNRIRKLLTWEDDLHSAVLKRTWIFWALYNMFQVITDAGF